MREMLVMTAFRTMKSENGASQARWLFPPKETMSLIIIIIFLQLKISKEMTLNLHFLFCK